MGRDDRQDINKLRPAGSDLPPRGKGIKDIKPKTPEKPKVKPEGYKGTHRDRD